MTASVSSKLRFSAASISDFHAVAIERTVFRSRHEHRPHEAQVSQQLERAALLRRRPVVELRDVELPGEMEQNPNFFLQCGDELWLGQNHSFLHVLKSLKKND